ncbi:type I-C CRISPR-associated protein Cas8c/Csd1 [Planctomycetota bacterium]
MILQRLCDYYDRLASDPGQAIAQEGFAPQKISFEIVINKDGTLHDIQDIRDTTGKKPAPRLMRLPYEKRTSGVKAMFLWDKAEYLLGWISDELSSAPDDESDAEKKKRLKKIDRVAECFQSTRNLHVEFGEQISNDEYESLVQFLASWNPADLSEKHKNLLADVGIGFGVFRIRNCKHHIHEIDQVRSFWATHNSSTNQDAFHGTCLVTGRTTDIARLHPVLKGVRDAQSSGASIVSFNDDAFTSYGKKQSYNAPVGESSAFKYATALNQLLRKESGRKIQVGDMTCVFWAESPTAAEDLFGFGLDDGQIEDESRANEIGNMLRRISNGEVETPDGGVGFYVLGISPNASRLSVRFWISGTADELVNRVASHHKRLDIIRSERDRDLIPLWLILAQTARESKEIQPLLGGAILRSILTGGPYPESLLAALIRRIRADQEVRHPRAAVIKAILNHNHSKEISIMLDTERTESAYHLGRLFASLERAQEDALPGLNATIKDRYFGAASATPITVFPRLIRLSQHHVGKLEGGKKVVAEKRLQEIMGRIDAFPSHLGLADQGLFAIGYYHQRQDFFTKKTKNVEASE